MSLRRSLSEARDTLGLSLGEILEAISDGELAVTMDGRRILIDAEEIERYRVDRDRKTGKGGGAKA